MGMILFRGGDETAKTSISFSTVGISRPMKDGSRELYVVRCVVGDPVF